ncbi:MAG: M1 family metallopeptidase [Vicinamibacterales bacterium]
MAAALPTPRDHPPSGLDRAIGVVAILRRMGLSAAVVALGATGADTRPAELDALQPAAPPPSARAPQTPGSSPSPRNANYSIDAQLDTARHIITGHEVITWRNVTANPTSELRLHLYYNAWRHSRTTWMTERRLGGRGADLLDRPEGDWASMTLTAVRLVGLGSQPPLDLLPRTHAIAPDDGNPLDETLVSVPLPSAVDSGETVNLEVSWTAKLPRTFARTGVVGDYYFVAQWFPKVGVLEDAGWRAHQFHAGTEFFSDYGVYDVRLRVPTGWVVGATGRELSRRDEGDGSTTHQYVESDVHDFAWTTSPRFIERLARFEHESLPPVEMRLLLQPEHAGQAERHFAATRATLKYYGEWYGPYPYGHVTIVDPAWQSDSGGMEYPTLFTAGTSWLAPASVADPESVTIHEAGHQFWYALVGTNEFEHAWLDEGFNTFSDARTLDEWGFVNHYSHRYFGGAIPWVYRDLPLSRAVDGNLLNWYRGAAEADAPATPSFRYYPATGGVITYAKTALWLHTLERHLGWPMLQRVMRTYFTRYRYRHPTPTNFFAVVNEVTGQDLTWFFDEVYRGSNTFDYAIGSLESGPVATTGLVAEAGADAAGAPGRLVFARQTTRPGEFETRVVVRRLGEATFPVDVLLTFADGSVKRSTWDGLDRWTLVTSTGPSPAVSAQVDPDRVLLLDVNYTNNSMTLTPRGGEAATKWAAAWLVWLEDVLLTWSSLV